MTGVPPKILFQCNERVFHTTMLPGCTGGDACKLCITRMLQGLRLIRLMLQGCTAWHSSAARRCLTSSVFWQGRWCLAALSPGW